MRIKSISIDGYRRFEEQEIDLEEQTTVLAGANNSGKTSLIDLLRVVLHQSKNFREDDFNTIRRLQWSTRLIEAALGGEAEYQDFLRIKDLAESTPSIDVRIEVSYDPSQDDIREFADFLMDLDPAKNSFFFLYRFAPKLDTLQSEFDTLYDEIQRGIQKESWSAVSDIDLTASNFLSLQASLDKALIRSCRVETFFADRQYKTLVKMDRSRFLELFHFRLIKATRPLDDTSDDNSGGLSKKLIEVAQESTEWAGVVASLPDLVLDAIGETQIRTLTSEGALKSLNKVVESIAKTNGTSKSDLFLDFQVSEADVIKLIARAMQTRYSSGGVSLGEASQGLGYSNLIYLHLETESFARAASTPEKVLLVNLMVVEEPESHMHPQMQNAFIDHLFERVRDAGQFQAIVTTHSNEIVRSSSVEKLRTLKIEDGKCRIIDLRKFHEGHVKGKPPEHQRLFSFLYSINFADVLFADKVVMYEGDTERMYIQALIKDREDLANLRTQYISYVQVGGAYAHIYKPLIADTLGIKTVIITDVDYEKESETSTVEEIKQLTTTNSTLNEFFSSDAADASGKRVNPTLGTLFSAISPETGLASLEGQPLLAVAFQSASEGYARTLEEAILAKLLQSEVWESKTKTDWVDFKRASGLEFTISSKNAPTIRNIVTSTARQKTDFMYSLLVRKDWQNETPNYILSALKWLAS